MTLRLVALGDDVSIWDAMPSEDRKTSSFLVFISLSSHVFMQFLSSSPPLFFLLSLFLPLLARVYAVYVFIFSPLFFFFWGGGGLFLLLFPCTRVFAFILPHPLFVVFEGQFLLAWFCCCLVSPHACFAVCTGCAFCLESIADGLVDSCWLARKFFNDCTQIFCWIVCKVLNDCTLYFLFLLDRWKWLYSFSLIAEIAGICFISKISFAHFFLVVQVQWLIDWRGKKCSRMFSQYHLHC